MFPMMGQPAISGRGGSNTYECVHVSWKGQRGLAQAIDIYLKRIDANGNSQWATDGVIVSNADKTQIESGIVGDGNGVAIVNWLDFRNVDDLDIYAQGIFSNGTLTVPDPLFFPTKSKNGKLSVIYLE